METSGGDASVTAQTVVQVSWAWTDLQAHHAAYAKCAQLSPCHTYLNETESEIAQSCPTLCDPMDYSPPDSSIHGIFQVRVLEWDAIAFSTRGALVKFSLIKTGQLFA